VSPIARPDSSPDDGERDRVVDGERSTHDGRPAREPCQYRIDSTRLRTDGVRVLVRQPAVDLGKELRPVAQQIEGDQRRDREQEGEIDHREAPADEATRDRAEQLRGPLACGRGEVCHT